ncbi:MAG: hypothetical protein HN559_17585 [Gemmatimonadetes bacterium]|nr:hypothetical protein [Gemmatimonadota bacterium]
MKLTALLCSGTVVGLLIGELFLRTVIPHRLSYRHPAFIVEDADVGGLAEQMADPLYGAGLTYTDKPWHYELKRNMKARLVSSEFNTEFETDSRGRRGPTATDEPQSIRILGLGDSFSMGFGVEQNDTYLSRLGSAIAQASSLSVDVTNGGVVGYAPGNSYHLLEGIIDEVRPDVVVFQLWVGDDLCLGAQAIRPVSLADVDNARRWRNLIRGSHIAMVLRDRIKGNETIRLWLMRRGYIQPFVTIQWLDRRFRDRCGGLDELSKLLQDTRELTDDRDIRLIVVLVPLLEQVDREAYHRALAYNGIAAPSDSVDFDAPNQVMQNIAARVGIDLLDVTEALRHSPNPSNSFFQRDPHLSSEGHRIVAEALARELTHELMGARPDHED